MQFSHKGYADGDKALFRQCAVESMNDLKCLLPDLIIACQGN